MRTNWFVGHVEGLAEVFQTDVREPTKDTHPKYDFCTGPFENENKAKIYKNWYNKSE